MLLQKYPSIQVQSKSAYHPYPTANEREPWEALDPALRQYWLDRGENALTYEWPSLLATRFLDYARDGNRSRYQNIQRERRQKVMDLVLAECMEGQGRFVDQLVNGLWLILEETYWGVPAHLDIQAAGRGLPDSAEPTVDLFAAETASLVAYVYYLVGPQLDAVSPLIRPRIEREIDRRILTPNLEREDFRWMGYTQHRGRRPNNWNPWICSNWINNVLLIEPDDTRRADSIAKIFQVLDFFLDPYPRDGGCDEGPSYWNRAAGALYDCLELLGNGAAVNMWDEPLVQEMGRFVYRAQVAGDWMVNFADAPATVFPDPALLFRYGQAINDPDMSAMGAWAAHQQNMIAPSASDDGTDRSRQSLMRALRLVFAHKGIAAADAYQPLPRDTFLPDIEVMIARDAARSTDGFCVAAKGGNNNESHNHNDIGQFVVYLDGNPVLIDAGVEEYTSKTFSDTRYDIWTMRSDYHNLPTIGETVQAPGNEYKAGDVQHSATDAAATFKLNIAGAYPENVKSWVRTVKLERGQRMVVEDQYDLDAAVPAITYSLMTASAVDLSHPGTIKLSERELPNGRKAGAATIQYDGDQFSASVESIATDDARMAPIWGDEIYRIVLTASNPPQSGGWTLEISR